MNYLSRSFAWFLQEFRRWVFTPTLWGITVIAAGLTVLSTYGTAETGATRISEGVTDAASLTELLLTMPFAGVLFTTFLGIVIVATDFDTKFSNRLLMLNRSVAMLIAVKSVVAGLLSTVVGAATLVAGRYSTQMLLKGKGIDFLPQMEALEWVRGYMLLYVTGAVWGVAVGLLFRNTALSLGVHFIYQTVAESAVIQAFPNVGKWLPGGAQAAMVQDPSLPERLNVVPGVGLYALWLVAIFTISLLLLHRSHQPPRGLLGRTQGSSPSE